MDKLPSNVKDEILQYLSTSPAIIAAVDEIVANLPDAIASTSVDVEDSVLQVVLARLREQLDKMDIDRIIASILKHDRLTGRIRVELDTIWLIWEDRFKATFREAIANETNLVRNFHEAKLAQRRAETTSLTEEIATRKNELNKAKIKFELAWLNFARLGVAIPSLALAAIVGAVVAINYLPAIRCHKGDPICKVRIRDGLYWKR
jgi:hypothetical protein